MTEPRFSMGEAVRFGWHTVTGNLGTFATAIIIIVVMNVFPVFFDSPVVAIVSWIFTMIVTLGIMRISLRFVDGETGELADLFATLPLVAGYLIASIFAGIAAGIAVIFLIIPGIYVGIRLQFYAWVIVDRGTGPFQALEQSWAITRGSVWRLFLFALLLGVVNLLGLLALGIGLLVTMPMALVALAHVYRSLARGAGD